MAADDARAAAREELARKVEGLPRDPGVYLFKDAAGAVLYVGKAKSLRERVRGYFQPGGDGRLFVRFIERRVADVEVVATRSEKEALLLENNLIKTHQPRYNVRLKDDKSFLHLRIDGRHAFPAIVPVRRPRKDGARYLGPYASARAIRTTLRLLRGVFPLRDCRDREFANRTRPCLKHQIGMCCAPCVGKVTQERYAELVESAVRVLQGETQQLVEQLQAQMSAASASLEYERAAVLRDRIAFLSTSTEVQAVESARTADRDAIGFARDGRQVEVCVLEFRGGKLLASRPLSLATELPDDEALSSFLGAWYGPGRPLPDEVALPFAAYAADAFAELWSERRGQPVRVHEPRAGAGLRALEMAKRNAQLALQTRRAQESIDERVLLDVQRRLGLARLPRRIECLDVSHTQGAAPVAGLVVFVDGRPERRDYRTYRVRTTAGNDDFGAMREVVARRFKPDGAPPPDLLLLDGGRPQVNAVAALLAERGVELALAGIVKPERRGRGLHLGAAEVDHVILPDRAEPVALPPDDEACFLLQRVRDEAHRFALASHRRARSRGALASELAGIPGLGASRRRALLAALGGLAALRAASAERIAEVPGIGPALAGRVWHALRRSAPE